MTNQLVNTVHQWLSLLNVSVEKEYIHQRLVSHPDYPSVLSITSLLNELGIENAAVQMEKEQLQEITLPFLAFIDQSDFILISDGAETATACKDFDKRWSGVVVLAENNGELMETKEMTGFRLDKHRSKIKWMFFSGIVSVLIFMACFQVQSLYYDLLLFSAMAGLVVSTTIVLRELGIDNLVSQQLCGKGTDTGCDTVLHSDAATFTLGIKLSDIGVAFFSGITLVLLISSFASATFFNAGRLLTTLFTFASLPFTLFSIYYQWRVAKRWCASCLLVIGILNVLILIQAYGGVSTEQTNLMQVVAAFSVFALPGTFWLLIRPLLNRKKELIENNIKLQRIYRSNDVLEASLKMQPTIDATPWEFDFQIGNAASSCQVMIVSNPYCGPCAEMHTNLKELLQKNRGQLGITVRFLINVYNGTDERMKVVEHMLQYAYSRVNFFQSPDKIEQMLTTWYQSADLQKFSEHYPVSKTRNIYEKLEQQTLWAQEAQVEFTPSIFINGYKLPSAYEQQDLAGIASNLAEIFSAEKITIEEYS
jgi:protein-disulfide isomerase